MGFFRIEHASGLVEHVEKSDCATAEDCANSMFGKLLAEVEEFGGKIVELAEDEFHALMSPANDPVVGDGSGNVDPPPETPFPSTEPESTSMSDSPSPPSVDQTDSGSTQTQEGDSNEK